MTPTVPGVVVLLTGNQGGVTIVDMQHPERETPPGAAPTPPRERVKRKYERRHHDKQLHEEHKDKGDENDGES